MKKRKMKKPKVRSAIKRDLFTAKYATRIVQLKKHKKIKHSKKEMENQND